MSWSAALVLFLPLLSSYHCHGLDWSKIRHRFMTYPDTGYRTPDARIIGGKEAYKHQFPYQVGIFIETRGSIGFCGGSLISDKAVLTAAHCTEGASKFEVHLGAQNIRNEKEPDHHIEISKEFVQHEFYNPRTFSNDIAIVKLKHAVSGNGIEIVRLPSPSFYATTYENEPAVVSGWGKVADSSSEINSELLYANVTVISNKECRRTFGPVITKTKLCTDSMTGTAGTCEGDSGGPLVIIDGKDGKPTLIGIVSFGAKSCENGAPSAYTRVTSHLEWIAVNSSLKLENTFIMICICLVLHALYTSKYLA